MDIHNIIGGKMAIKFRTVITISDSFRDILKQQRYEEFVLITINRFQSLIKNLPLSRVENNLIMNQII